jgi:nitric oxide dioxygenase
LRNHPNLVSTTATAEAPDRDLPNPCDNERGFIDAAADRIHGAGKGCGLLFLWPAAIHGRNLPELLKWGIPPAQAHFEFFGPRQELTGSGTRISFAQMS